LRGRWFPGQFSRSVCVHAFQVVPVHLSAVLRGCARTGTPTPTVGQHFCRFILRSRYVGCCVCTCVLIRLHTVALAFRLLHGFRYAGAVATVISSARTFPVAFYWTPAVARSTAHAVYLRSTSRITAVRLRVLVLRSCRCRLYSLFSPLFVRSRCAVLRILIRFSGLTYCAASPRHYSCALPVFPGCGLAVAAFGSTPFTRLLCVRTLPCATWLVFAAPFCVCVFVCSRQHYVSRLRFTRFAFCVSIRVTYVVPRCVVHCRAQLRVAFVTHTLPPPTTHCRVLPFPGYTCIPAHGFAPRVSFSFCARAGRTRCTLPLPVPTVRSGRKTFSTHVPDPLLLIYTHFFFFFACVSFDFHPWLDVLPPF